MSAKTSRGDGEAFPKAIAADPVMRKYLEGKLTIDDFVNIHVRVGRRLAKDKEIPVAKAFAQVTQYVRTSAGKRPSSWAEHVATLKTPFAQRREETRADRLLILRLDLEAALLRLDDCFPLTAVGADLPTNQRADRWPTRDELDALDELVDETVRVLGKRTPRTRWARCQKIDRQFPKLRLCRRIARLSTQMAIKMPARPLAGLIPTAGSKDEELAKSFFTKLSEVRKGECDPEKEDWFKFEPLLLVFQNAELQRAGKVPRTTLGREDGKVNGPDATKAYFTFMDLDRADRRYLEQFSDLHDWGRSLARDLVQEDIRKQKAATKKADAAMREAKELVSKLAPFCAGPVNLMEHWSELSRTHLERERKAKNAARKAKSRKKKRQKV